MEDNKFLVDVMLIKLGRWLRILGYDCAIPDLNNHKDIQDLVLAERAKEEGRILLTMDRELEKVAKNSNTKIVLIPSNLSHLRDQLRFLFKKDIIDSSILNNIEKLDEKTKCVNCNSLLRLINKEDFDEVENLNEWIKKRYLQIWQCEECKHIYWKGSHWKKMINTLEEIKRKI